MPLKPIAFRIHDFKSIQDSGTCHLSGDAVTVLAGQNESGKTSILQALRDFDRESKKEPATPDYEPDHNPEDCAPKVSVCFACSPDDIKAVMAEERIALPEPALRSIIDSQNFWISRDLRAGTYALDSMLASHWTEPLSWTAVGQDGEQTGLTPPTAGSSEEAGGSADDAKLTFPSAEEFADLLRPDWPLFVYFDSFGDLLPREFPVPLAEPAAGVSSAPASGAKKEGKIPQIVADFLAISGIDLARVRDLAGNGRKLGNYLQSRSAEITGDFLTYWKQRTGSAQSIELRARGDHDATGELRLSFYVHDSHDQYADQRSQGFRWFLSFYLRLAASVEDQSNSPRVVLIDEPGTFLHMKAQHNILDLLEQRITRRDFVIYSTHSPYLLPWDRNHRVRLVVRDAKTGTFIADRLTDGRVSGDAFSDALSPVLTSIGIDMSQNFSLIKKKNVVTEGISEFYYLHAWARILNDDLFSAISVFPGTGAASVVTLASLLIGWGVNFCCLLDRDGNGNSSAQKLKGKMGVREECVIQPAGAAGVEDLFSPADFTRLLGLYEPRYSLEAKERPSAAISRQKIDKALLATRFSELVSKGEFEAKPLTEKTLEAIRGLFATIRAAVEISALSVPPS